jgi:hypothetical protein
MNGSTSGSKRWVPIDSVLLALESAELQVEFQPSGPNHIRFVPKIEVSVPKTGPCVPKSGALERINRPSGPVFGTKVHGIGTKGRKFGPGWV